MCGKRILIEGGLHRRSHNIPLMNIILDMAINRDNIGLRVKSMGGITQTQNSNGIIIIGQANVKPIERNRSL